MDYPIKLSEVNEFITCPVCHGYLIDATTICECLHTFCRDCIVDHITNRNNNDCPKCSTVIHDSWPLDYILRDQGKQDLVYKIVPQLYISEMLRKLASGDTRGLDRITRQVLKKNFIYVALVQQQKQPATFVPEALSIDPAQATQQHEEQQQVNPNVRKIPKSIKPIYLKCPFKVRVLQLRKLLAIKYQLKASDRVCLLYKGDIVSDTDQISNLGQSISFVLHYEISRFYTTPDQASTSSSTMSNDSDKMSSIDE